MALTQTGVIAQLVERYNGIVEASSGLGHRPFTAVTGVRIPVGTVFVLCVIAGFLFYRDLPDFKISMQAFMQSQKQWKCRECAHEWEV